MKRLIGTGAEKVKAVTGEHDGALFRGEFFHDWKLLIKHGESASVLCLSHRAFRTSGDHLRGICRHCRNGVWVCTGLDQVGMLRNLVPVNHMRLDFRIARVKAGKRSSSYFNHDFLFHLYASLLLRGTMPEYRR